VTAEVTVRAARPDDGPALLSLIEALAHYEKLTPPDAPSRERFLAHLASDDRPFDALLAEVDGNPVGYAVFFETYSTFRAAPKLYLEDIFVLPDFRGSGAGYVLFAAVARHARDRGCVEMEWEVLDWNRLAIDFYERLGARRDTQWLTYRLDRDGIERIAG
jgi:GNAT superfamily N-acetyltransferase